MGPLPREPDVSWRSPTPQRSQGGGCAGWGSGSRYRGCGGRLSAGGSGDGFVLPAGIDLGDLRPKGDDLIAERDPQRRVPPAFQRRFEFAVLVVEDGWAGMPAGGAGHAAGVLNTP